MARKLLFAGVVCIFGGESFCILGPLRYERLIHVICHTILYSGIALAFVGTFCICPESAAVCGGGDVTSLVFKTESN